ncbi:NADH-quinone oxidoreductase subunit E [Puniceibacterium sediminis]|uniref:NADH dehydrogenase subunit E n=1 Tax=Puniceibacterium sediminis TaxID=1608407 RepID=A0A238W7S6_9RHOB|nr:NADH-quinone oxidoreductase subunit E [Puniceibacterium sediminis]SNR42568.1 NADH dehydrogenase subunit E [Puniceibacterium sediminis]
MLRRLHKEQPAAFAFTPDNLAWAQAQITKYPEGRQASAIIPLLWRAQEQEGWLTRPAIETIADMLGMAYMRALEVASFYFMFQLQPVGSVANIQVCGTTSCMICGAEDLVAVCKEKIAAKPHTLSADGKFTWEEVECLGACANAPMAQIGKDYYEDLTTGRLAEILDEMAAGRVPLPGPQNGRYAAEPKSGLTSLTEYAKDRAQYNASVQFAVDIGDTIKRIDGTEVPLTAPWQDRSDKTGDAIPDGSGPVLAGDAPIDETGIDRRAAPAESTGRPRTDEPAKAAESTPVSEGASDGQKPESLSAAREGGPDNLKLIKGVGPKLEVMLNGMGFYHFDQIAGWSAAEIAWVDQNLEGFKGRVTRDDWVAQAGTLASGGETEFASRVKKGDVEET